MCAWWGGGENELKTLLCTGEEFIELFPVFGRGGGRGKYDFNTLRGEKKIGIKVGRSAGVVARVKTLHLKLPSVFLEIPHYHRRVVQLDFYILRE